MLTPTPLLALLTFLLMLPVTLPVPVLRGLVLERYALDELATSLFMVVNMAGAFVVAPLTGALADRGASRRRLGAAAVAADALLLASLALPVPFPLLLALRTLEGAAHITALSCLLAVAADGAEPGRRGRVMGAVGAGLTLGVATGAALGGVLGRRDPLLVLWVAAGLLAIVGAGWLHWLREPPRASRPALGWRRFAAAVADPALRLPLAFAFADRFTVGFFTTGFPLYVKGPLQQSPATVGLLLGLFLYPFALLSYPFGRLAEHRSRLALVVAGSAVYGAGTAVVAVVPPGLLPALMPLLGIASAVMFVPTMLLTVERAPAAVRTTAMATFNAAGSIGFLLGPLACGALIAFGRDPADPAAGYRLAFAVAGASELVLCAVVLAGRLRAPTA